MVQVHPDPPSALARPDQEGIPGAIAQLGERLLCKQEVTGSIPVGSTSTRFFQRMAKRLARDASPFVVRLLFNNSEEVKRTRFSQTGFVWVVIALMSERTSPSLAHQALPMIRGAAEAPERPRSISSFAVLRVIGSSEQVHVVDALATTGDEGRCSLR